MTDIELPEAASNLFSPQTADDPHTSYGRMRSECPVARGEMLGNPVVMISRYEDVHWALRHPEYFTSEGGSLDLGEQPLLPLQVDPPMHTAYRRMLNPQFVPKEIQKLEPEVRKLVNELIDGFASRGSVDFHEEFATPLPSGIFLALMGLSFDDMPMFLQWRDDSIRPKVEPGDFEGAAKIRMETAHEITEYFKEKIAHWQEHPGDGLFSKIVHSEVDGRPLTETELLGICHLLLLGGLDTVTATLDCMIVHLARHPEDRDRLVDNPASIPAAVEELLRAESPVMVVPRTVKQDFELGGVALKEGDAVTIVIGAANGDEGEFGDRSIDLDRETNRHVAFGSGHHLCLGAHLARLELRIALEEFHRRLPDYRIPEGTEIHFSPGIRQADNLPLEFSPA
jgi:cytochrome P450